MQRNKTRQQQQQQQLLQARQKRRCNSFVEWLTNESIGLVILTSICAVAIQNALRGVEALVVNYTLSRQNIEQVYYSSSLNTINYMPASQMDINANYKNQSSATTSSGGTGNTSTDQDTINPTHPGATNDNLDSNGYLPTPHVFYTILLIFAQLCFYFGLAYGFYIIFVRKGMKPLFKFIDEEENENLLMNENNNVHSLNVS